MLEREESRHDLAFIAGVVIGAIAGAAATLALTPMSGAEARDKLKARTNEIDLSHMKERAGSVAESAQHAVAPMRERVAPVAERVAPVREKVSELAAKAPFARHPSADDAPVADSGFGPHGAHTMEPAEGSATTPPREPSAGVVSDTRAGDARPPEA